MKDINHYHRHKYLTYPLGEIRAFSTKPSLFVSSKPESKIPSEEPKETQSLGSASMEFDSVSESEVSSENEPKETSSLGSASMELDSNSESKASSENEPKETSSLGSTSMELDSVSEPAPIKEVTVMDIRGVTRTVLNGVIIYDSDKESSELAGRTPDYDHTKYDDDTGLLTEESLELSKETLREYIKKTDEVKRHIRVRTEEEAEKRSNYRERNHELRNELQWRKTEEILPDSSSVSSVCSSHSSNGEIRRPYLMEAEDPSLPKPRTYNRYPTEKRELSRIGYTPTGLSPGEPDSDLESLRSEVESELPSTKKRKYEEEESLKQFKLEDEEKSSKYPESSQGGNGSGSTGSGPKGPEGGGSSGGNAPVQGSNNEGNNTSGGNISIEGSGNTHNRGLAPEGFSFYGFLAYIVSQFMSFLSQIFENLDPITFSQILEWLGELLKKIFL